MWLTAGLFHELVDRRPECLALGAPPARRRRRALARPRAPRARGSAAGRQADERLRADRDDDLRHSPTTSARATAVGGPVPLGRPIQGDHLRRARRATGGRGRRSGSPGELWIGGDGVARGYRGRPGADRRAVRPDPAGPAGAATAPATACAAAPDGTLEFLGRVDRQVKVRGVRVEPAEVEGVLRAHPAVADAAVVIPFERAPGDLALAAYVVAEDAGQIPGSGRAAPARRRPPAGGDGAGRLGRRCRSCRSTPTARSTATRLPDPGPRAPGRPGPAAPARETRPSGWSSLPSKRC